MWQLARRFGILLSDLIKANPQVVDSAVLKKGDILYIPGAGAGNPDQQQNILMPCSLVLIRDRADVPADALGAALVRKLEQIRPGRTSISIMAHGLPDPSSLGHFNSYEGIAFIPGVITWRWQLFPTSEPLPTWAGTFTEITAALTPGTVVQVRPLNTATGQGGNPLLTGAMGRCNA